MFSIILIELIPPHYTACKQLHAAQNQLNYHRLKRNHFTAFEALLTSFYSILFWYRG